MKSILRMAFATLTLAVVLVGCKDSTIDPTDPAGVTPEVAADTFGAYFATAGNLVADPMFAANSIVPGITNWGTLSTPPAGMVTTTYKGAINPTGTPWYDGWSFYSRIIAGTPNSDVIPSRPTKEITDAMMQSAGNTVNWTKDTTYILKGRVFVNDGQTLNIAAGTIIKGDTGQGDNAAALIVARGGMINATGTAAEPIIFTFRADNGGTAATTRGQWGGLIILGKARLNSTPGETAIEGIPTTETRGLYGGNNDADNSGTLTYVSIRHGGTDIGAGNEINGLTLGGVGSATTLSYVEVVGNKDDGFEWFGGTVNGDHLLSVFCADDALDYDEGYRGMNQFIVVHQDPADADRGGEHDGGTNPETGTPYATPFFYNVTSVGAPTSRAVTMRDNAGGEYHNSIFVDYANGFDIELIEGDAQHSYAMWLNGLLKIENNIFHNIGAGTTGPDIFTISVP
jgi:hypothetical protein